MSANSECIIQYAVNKELKMQEICIQWIDNCSFYHLGDAKILILNIVFPGQKFMNFKSMIYYYFTLVLRLALYPSHLLFSFPPFWQHERIRLTLIVGQSSQ